MIILRKCAYVTQKYREFVFMHFNNCKSFESATNPKPSIIKTSKKSFILLLNYFTSENTIACIYNHSILFKNVVFQIASKGAFNLHTFSVGCGT